MFEGDSTPTAIDRPVHDPWGTPMTQAGFDMDG